MFTENAKQLAAAGLKFLERNTDIQGTETETHVLVKQFLQQIATGSLIITAPQENKE